jgi:hypothetical protein
VTRSDLARPTGSAGRLRSTRPENLACGRRRGSARGQVVWTDLRASRRVAGGRAAGACGDHGNVGVWQAHAVESCRTRWMSVQKDGLARDGGRRWHRAEAAAWASRPDECFTQGRHSPQAIALATVRQRGSRWGISLDSTPSAPLTMRSVNLWRCSVPSISYRCRVRSGLLTFRLRVLGFSP